MGLKAKRGLDKAVVEVRRNSPVSWLAVMFLSKEGSLVGCVPVSVQLPKLFKRLLFV